MPHFCNEDRCCYLIATNANSALKYFILAKLSQAVGLSPGKSANRTFQVTLGLSGNPVTRPVATPLTRMKLFCQRNAFFGAKLKRASRQRISAAENAKKGAYDEDLVSRTVDGLHKTFMAVH